MGIDSRRAATGAAAALLLCFVAAGAAGAEEVPSDNTTISTDQTTDINGREGWEDNNDVPLSEKAPTLCDTPSTWYVITSKKAYHVPSWWNGTRYKDGPGGTMAVSVTKSGTISAEFSASGEWSAGAILAKAKTTVSFKVGASVSVAVGHNYTHDVGRNKYGHLQYGSWGYKITWKRYRSGSGSSCGGVEIAHGSATLPTSETGWNFWETSS